MPSRADRTHTRARAADYKRAASGYGFTFTVRQILPWWRVCVVLHLRRRALTDINRSRVRAMILYYRVIYLLSLAFFLPIKYNNI